MIVEAFRQLADRFATIAATYRDNDAVPPQPLGLAIGRDSTTPAASL